MGRLYDMIVIGGGPGGCTAALYAARAGLSVLLLEGGVPGGQMALTGRIDNYPGFPGGIAGFDLAQRMVQQIEEAGAKVLPCQALSLELSANPKAVTTLEGIFRARTLVYAAGAEPRHLGLAGEDTFTGRGVHYCAQCDGMFYRGKTVVVVGGGNTAVSDALLLHRVAKQVHLVHRRDTLRASQVSFGPLLEAENVSFHWNSTPTRLLGGEALTGVILTDTVTGAETELRCDGMFVSIGRTPATELVGSQLSLDQSGYIIAGESTKTAIAGVFAVGDVRTKSLRQIVTALSDGATAASRAEEYLNRNQ